MYQIALNKLLLFHLIIVELRFGMDGKISLECWIGFVSVFCIESQSHKLVFLRLVR